MRDSQSAAWPAACQPWCVDVSRERLHVRVAFPWIFDHVANNESTECVIRPLLHAPQTMHISVRLMVVFPKAAYRRSSCSESCHRHCRCTAAAPFGLMLRPPLWDSPRPGRFAADNMAAF